MNPHNLVTMSQDLLSDVEEWECSDCGLIAPSSEELNLLDCTAAKPNIERVLDEHDAAAAMTHEKSWPPELIAMSHEQLIVKVVDLSNHLAEFVADEHTQKTAALSERLACLVASAYDYIGRDTDENFVKEWKRTAIEDFDIVAEKLNCGIVKNCPVPPVCTSGDWFDFIGDGINGRIGVEELFSMGFKLWAEAGDGEGDEQWLPEGGSLWLMPVNWFQELPEDVDFVHFDGLSVSKKAGTATRDHRMGYMTFGIVHIEAQVITQPLHPVLQTEGYLGDELPGPKVESYEPCGDLKLFEFKFQREYGTEDGGTMRLLNTFTHMHEATVWGQSHAEEKKMSLLRVDELDESGEIISSIYRPDGGAIQSIPNGKWT